MIEAHNLTKRYGTVTAVDDLSFSLRPGLVTGFLGPNGAGKTTTMRMILGLDRPTRGTVTVAGRNYRDLQAPLHEVGALLDAKAMHGGRTAYHHLLCLAQSNDIKPSRVREVLRLVGLEEVASRRAGGFSLGMGQRLGIAGALLGDPPVLMFDEPVNGLDPEGIVWVRTLMRSLAADGRTVLVSSHLMSEMALTADHLVVIGRGRLIADAAVSDFVERSAQHSVLVRSPQLDQLAQALTAAGAKIEPETDGAIGVRQLDARAIGELAAQRGFVLYELTPRRPSLEEAFMELTKGSVDFQASPAGGGGMQEVVV